MDKTNRWIVLAFTVLGGLGGLACIFQWLGIKPGDLQMTATIPHWLWLVFALLLFGVSISLSFLSWRSSGKTIAEAVVPEREEIQRLETALNDSARANLDYRGERDRCEEEKRALQKRFDHLLTPLQIEAIQLAHDLLETFKRVGPEPLPKYTAEEIKAMPTAQMKQLILADDGDYAEACEYHFGGDSPYFRMATEGSMARSMVAKWNRLMPYYEKVSSAYAVELEAKVKTIRHRFIVEGINDEAFILKVEGREGRQRICSIAEALWRSAYKLKEKEVQS